MGERNGSPQRRIGIVLMLVVACANEGQPRRATWTRRATDAHQPVHWNASALERLGLGPGPAARARPSARTPSGWIEREPGALQLARFDVPGGATCTWTEFSGTAGGELANVNRWREQSGLEPLASAALLELATVAWGDREALLVEHLDATPALLGLIAVGAEGSRFLKLTGPSEAVSAARESFLAFARSYGQPDTPTPPATTEPQLAQIGPLTFVVPPDWMRGTDRPMRLATWSGDGWECSVTILNGDGGGLAANVGRWYAQLGHAAPSEGELAELARLPGELGAAALIELDGNYRGMRGESLADASLLGAIQIGPARSVFVKVIGRQAAVHALRPRFDAFYAAIREAR